VRRNQYSLAKAGHRNAFDYYELHATLQGADNVKALNPILKNRTWVALFNSNKRINVPMGRRYSPNTEP
jgi:hypothetical protein